MNDASWRCPYCEDGVIYCATVLDLERSVQHHLKVLHPAYGQMNLSFDPEPSISEPYMQGRRLSPFDVKFLMSIRIRWNPPAFYQRQLRA